MMKSGSLWDSFRYAFEGVLYVLRTQRNMRIHLSIAALVVTVGLFLDLTFTQWAVLSLTIGLVLVGEMLNTAVEALVDLVCPDHHVLAKVVKDVMAGVILLTAIFSVIVGLFVLGPPLWAYLIGS